MSLVKEGKAGGWGGGVGYLTGEWLQQAPNRDDTPHYDEIADS